MRGSGRTTRVEPSTKQNALSFGYVSWQSGHCFIAPEEAYPAAGGVEQRQGPRTGARAHRRSSRSSRRSPLRDEVVRVHGAEPGSKVPADAGGVRPAEGGRGRG